MTLNLLLSPIYASRDLSDTPCTSSVGYQNMQLIRLALPSTRPNQWDRDLSTLSFL